MNNLNLDEYVTTNQFNNMCLKERVDIVNEMLEYYDVKTISNCLGIDVGFLFWLFNYKLEGNKFVEKR